MLKVFTFLSPGWESSNKSSAVVQAVTAVSQVCGFYFDYNMVFG